MDILKFSDDSCSVASIKCQLYRIAFNWCSNVFIDRKRQLEN